MNTQAKSGTVHFHINIKWSYIGLETEESLVKHSQYCFSVDCYRLLRDNQIQERSITKLMSGWMECLGWDGQTLN